MTRSLRAALALAALLGAGLGDAAAQAAPADAAAAQAAPAPQAAPTAQRTGRRSWTADRRAFAVGDLVTVLVDEYTLASANRGNYASDRRFRDLGVGASQTVTSTQLNGTVDVSTVNDAESRQRGEATRQNRFQGELTTRVVEVGPGGMLRIEGSKVINLDDHSETLTLSGWVRPQDVGNANLIDSWRVAEAEMVYSSDDSLSSPRGGILGRILGRIWP